MSLGLCTEKLKLNDKAVFLCFYAIYLYVKHKEALIDIFTETGTDGYFVTSVVLTLQYLFHTHPHT